MRTYTATSMLIVVLSACAGAEVSYTYLSPSGAPNGRGQGINDLGQVTGIFSPSSSHPGFFWDGTQIIELGFLSSTESTSGNDINGAGQIVGDSSLGADSGHWSGHIHAFLWENGLLTDLRTLDNRVNSIATGINEVGQIVGSSYNSYFADRRAVMWDNGTILDIHPRRGVDNSFARAINNQGQVAISARDTVSQNSCGFIWDNGAIIELGDLVPRDISNAGQVVGYMNTASGGHVASWTGGTITDLTLITGINGEARAVNDHGDIVFRDPVVSYLWSDGTVVNLNEVISELTRVPVGSFSVVEAEDINNKGQITGFWQKGGHVELFILTPAVPSPLQVCVDIKPRSCPNPVNTKSQGVLPVAILGTEDFLVSDIDPASVRLEEVAALRSNLEDVAAPVESGSACDCTMEGPDGFVDMTLKFDTQEVLEILGPVEDGQERNVKLTGSTWEGKPIEGSDCILIIKKDDNGKKPKK